MTQQLRRHGLMSARGINRAPISEQIIRDAFVGDYDVVLAGEVEAEERSVGFAPGVEFEPAVEGWDVGEIAYERFAGRTGGQLGSRGYAVLSWSEEVEDGQG